MAARVGFAIPRVASLTASPTMAVAQKCRALRERGVDVVDFGPGEPDFDTPANIRDAAARALADGLTHYAPSRGLPLLREAIAEKLLHENDLVYDPATEIIVTPGAKQAILEAILTVAGRGDEVIVLDPAWVSYEAIVRLADATPVHVQLQADFSIEPRRLEEAVGSRTRAVIVGSPGNPSGKVLSLRELEHLAATCRRHDLVLISDEIYERIRYGGAQIISPATLSGMWDRTITINGFSKAYAMTGWRLGYLAAPKTLTEEILKVQEHSVTTATSFAQAGAIEALQGPQEELRLMVEEFARRRRLIVDGLNQLPGYRCGWPDGAFYVFADVSGTGLTGSILADQLLDHGVAVTPGRAFGTAWDTHVRLSYATSQERIRTGLQRMAEALSQVGG